MLLKSYITRRYDSSGMAVNPVAAPILQAPKGRPAFASRDASEKSDISSIRAKSDNDLLFTYNENTRESVDDMTI